MIWPAWASNPDSPITAARKRVPLRYQQRHRGRPAVGAFSHKFSIDPSSETDRIKKVTRCKTGTNLLYHHAEYSGIAGRAPAVDEKVWCFCLSVFVRLFVTLWNYEVYDDGNAMKQCKFQNNYGVIACRKVCGCASIFNFFSGPHNFPLGKNYTRNTNFGACKPTF